MPVCPTCGTNLENNSQVCPNCGVAPEKAAKAAPPAPPTPQPKPSAGEKVVYKASAVKKEEGTSTPAAQPFVRLPQQPSEPEAAPSATQPTAPSAQAAPSKPSAPETPTGKTPASTAPEAAEPAAPAAVAAKPRGGKNKAIALVAGAVILLVAAAFAVWYFMLRTTTPTAAELDELLAGQNHLVYAMEDQGYLAVKDKIYPLGETVYDSGLAVSLDETVVVYTRAAQNNAELLWGTPGGNEPVQVTPTAVDYNFSTYYKSLVYLTPDRELFTFNGKSSTKIADGVDAFVASSNQQQFLYRSGGSMFKMEKGGEPVEVLNGVDTQAQPVSISNDGVMLFYITPGEGEGSTQLNCVDYTDSSAPASHSLPMDPNQFSPVVFNYSGTEMLYYIAQQAYLCRPGTGFEEVVDGADLIYADYTPLEEKAYPSYSFLLQRATNDNLHHIFYLVPSETAEEGAMPGNMELFAYNGQESKRVSSNVTNYKYDKINGNIAFVDGGNSLFEMPPAEGGGFGEAVQVGTRVDWFSYSPTTGSLIYSQIDADNPATSHWFLRAPGSSESTAVTTVDLPYLEWAPDDSYYVATFMEETDGSVQTNLVVSKGDGQELASLPNASVYSNPQAGGFYYCTNFRDETKDNYQYNYAELHWFNGRDSVVIEESLPLSWGAIPEQTPAPEGEAPADDGSEPAGEGGQGGEGEAGEGSDEAPVTDGEPV